MELARLGVLVADYPEMPDQVKATIERFLEQAITSVLDQGREGAPMGELGEACDGHGGLLSVGCGGE